jgi:glyoxylase-like metal-dependent hydrolase (beta-lactamase superfamily II)/rhodanese-related sulfurtransferase
MYFKQFYLGCLAHASYLIGSDKEAAVIDPQRDVEQYILEAEAQSLTIKYVIETHLHADFVSGHRELASRTGAEIVFGARANATFPHVAVNDGHEVRIGQVTLRILETPGHTPEGISILVIDHQVSAQPQKVLTGDTLFIGDVGRPDLVGSKGFTAQQMAEMLYDSLHTRLLPLNDEVEVYPAHGAGSMCGRNISSDTSSTIGEQRRFNYALQPMAKEAFVRLMTTDLPEPPAYFSRDAEINRTGAAPLEELPSPKALTPEEVHREMAEGTLALDVRRDTAFGTGHLPGSLNIGLSGQFASWAGSLIPLETPIILIGEDVGQVEEAVLRLARVGIENVKGYLSGGILAWNNAGLALSAIAQMPVNELQLQLGEGRDLQVIDVRRPAEYGNGHAPGAINAPLATLEKELAKFAAARPTAVICQSGYRSSAASSILEKHGFTEIYNVVGGTLAWINAGFAVEGSGDGATCQSGTK